LKTIKEAMGTQDFAKLVFDKVFNTDIYRLLSMGDMWKNRTPPNALQYADYDIPDDDKSANIARDDQSVWDLLANIAVFKHRFVRWWCWLI
jgi:ubiquitin-like 1-activating enzyme E1 B